MTSLKVTRNGVPVIIDSIEDLLEEASDFYAELYSRKVTADDVTCATSFLEGSVKTKLADAEASLCDNPLTDDELFNALKKLPKGKVPGIDGLPVEFFIAFWEDLKGSFSELVQSAFDSFTLPETMRTSIITLIFKKKSREDIRNYRPISLLCSDYKIIAKALAERMKAVLPSVIHKDQTGFLKNRYIGENVTLFLDTQEYLSRNEKRGYAFLADWENAYDRIDRSFIEQSLTAFGFGPRFCRWFHLLHNDSSAQVIVNGFLSGSFKVNSGVRQGCPWAPFLFLVGIEPLACALRQQNDVQGISLPNNSKILYSGYADDTTLFISDLQDLDRCIKVLDAYSKCSGMKLNLLKSTVVPLGSASRDEPPDGFRFKWLSADDDPESLLGVPVSLDYDPESAWNSMIKKLADSIKSWTAQRLSIFGRVHAARSYIGSKSWYLATMIPPASKCLKTLTSMLWRFLQTNANMDLGAPSNRYYSPWSKAFLAQDAVSGGLNVQDYEAQLTATLAKWVFKLADPRHIASWKALPFQFFEERFPGMGLSLLSADPCIARNFGRNAGRWFGFLQAWLQSGLHVAEPPKDYHCILNESLWFNRHLLYPPKNKNGRPFGKCIEDKLIRCGFTRVSDLLSSVTNNENAPMFMSDDEAEARTGSKHLANIIHQIIYDVIPLGWKIVVHRRIREPFIRGDWFIEQSAAAAAECPTVYQVRNVTQTLIVGEAYSCLMAGSSMLIKSTPLTVRLLQTDDVVKACVMKDRDGHLIYCGNYADCKLLLSRISWSNTISRKADFFDFSIKMIYRSIIDSRDKNIPALHRWNRILSTSIDSQWIPMFKYLHDPILNNRCKEVLYKIYTQVLPVGTNIERFGKPNNCCFCDDAESEFHLFI